MRTTYKNVEIVLDEDTGKFQVEELDLETELWSEATSAIRAAIKTEKAASVRIPVIYFSAWGRKSEDMFIGYAGKKVKAPYSSKVSFWFFNGKSRSKESADDLYYDTPENRTIITEYLRQMQEARTMEDKASDYLKTAKTLETEE